MLFPSFFSDDLFDEIFNDRNNRVTHSAPVMATDVVSGENDFELRIELPGCKKENVKAQLKNGYLTVSAQVGSEVKETEKLMRRERYTGSCTRSFYVGEALLQEDIKARFEDGVLFISFPKAPEHPELEDRHMIEIAG